MFGETFETRLQRRDIAPIPTIDIREAIADTAINPEAQNLLDEVHQSFLTPKFIHDFALVAAPPDYHGRTIQAMTKEDWQRSLLFPNYSSIVYGDPPIQAAFIQTKGNLRTGRSRNKTKEQIVLRESMQNAPWGFFEYSGAQKEQEIANRLIQEGIPAGLVLGTIILDPVKLQNIIEMGYGKNTHLGADLLDSLDILLENKDLPAIMVRLADTQGRIGAQKESDSIIKETNLYSAVENLGFFDYELREEFMALFRNSTNYNLRQLPNDQLLQKLINGSMNVIRPYKKSFEKLFSDDEFKQKYADLVAFMPRDVGQRFMLYDFEAVGKDADHYSRYSPSKLSQIYENSMGRSLVHYYTQLMHQIFEYDYYIEYDDPDLYDWGKDLDLRLEKMIRYQPTD